VREKEETEFLRRVGEQEARKLRAKGMATQTIWSGFGMFGIIGWSVVTPTLIGAALGAWLDRRYPSTYSWTLVFIVTGLMVGCLNAWHWVAKEYGEIQEDELMKGHQNEK
jgi:ATP synthase protein I